MSKIYGLLFLLIALLAGLYFMQPAGPTSWSTLQWNSGLAKQKCVGSDGQTHYGQAPEGVTCMEQAAIKESPVIISTDELRNAKRRSAWNDDYECDGRTLCPEMTSCDEARYFLENCPEVKMDSDGDGIPCEQKWCK